MNRSIRTIVLGSLLLMLSEGGLGQDERGEPDKEATAPGGFFFPEWDSLSRNGYVGVFPVSRLSGYHVFGSDQSAHAVGDVSGTPFVFHSGPDYCGWIGIPGFGWFGCGLHPVSSTIGINRNQVDESRSGAEQAVHLTQGMSKAKVSETVGSPSKKILLGAKEVWEYSGYSLLFESGSLKEIR